MDFELSSEQRLLQQTVREFAAEQLAPGAAQRDRTGEFHLPQLQQMAQLGLMGMNVPEQYGGSEVGPVAYVLAMIEIGRGDASVAVSTSVTNMVAENVYRFGNEEQRRLWLPQIVSGDHPIGAFGLTESQAGSDATNLRTKAVRDGDEWVVNGSKIFITNGETASTVLVMAVTDPQHQSKARRISAFLVHRDNPGMHVLGHEDKMGQRSSNTASLSFDDCRVPDTARLSDLGQGFVIAMTSLDSGRLGVAGLAIGIAEAALNAALEYSKQREQFGRPLAKLQAIQWMLADSRTELDAATLLLLRAAALKQRGGVRYTREASMAKLYATEAANRVVNRALQIHGGYGYIAEYPVERHLRDARVTMLYEGTSEVQRIVIAREQLAD
ncbi:MAG: acyl-CoA dehydrogenase family protein [Candidatus Alcyoniella australis]|nr:acyl-CoA dehydrogenase family protein [Candidatus Alcyoniella australis]